MNITDFYGKSLEISMINFKLNWVKKNDVTLS